MTLARIVRGKVLTLKEREFVEAARALGVPAPQIMRRHLLPNLVGEITVTVSLTVAAAILAESTLGFLGLGVSATHTATWGNMLGGDEGFVTTAPWLVWGPGLAIVITEFCRELTPRTRLWQSDRGVTVSCHHAAQVGPR